MLHLVRQYLDKKHMEMYGSYLIYVDSQCVQISKISLRSGQKTIDLHGAFNYQNEGAFSRIFDEKLKGLIHPKAIVNVVLASELSEWSTFPVDGFPDKPEARESFVKWRHSNYAKRDTNFSFCFDPVYTSEKESLISVLTSNHIVKTFISKCHEQSFCLNTISPSLVYYPKFLEMYLPEKSDSYVLLIIESQTWYVLYFHKGKCLYRRHHEWQTHDVLQVEYKDLIHDCKQIATFFNKRYSIANVNYKLIVQKSMTQDELSIFNETFKLVNTHRIFENFVGLNVVDGETIEQFSSEILISSIVESARYE